MLDWGRLSIEFDILKCERQLTLERAAQRARLGPLPQRPSWFARLFAALLARLRRQKAPMPVARRDHRRSCASPVRRCPVCGASRSARAGRMAARRRCSRRLREFLERRHAENAPPGGA
jgi:hypothetical protein